MIVFMHRPSRCGWEFRSEACGLQGASRSLEDSVDNAEHAARHYLSRLQGRAVLQDDARQQVDHIIKGAEASESPAPSFTSRFDRPS